MEEKNYPVMLDLETLSTRPNALLLSIGACKFDPDTGEIVDRFYVAIDQESYAGYDFHVCPRTLHWWEQQSLQARLVLSDPTAVPLSMALEEFSKWIGVDAEVWGNGAAADNVWLRHAYEATGRICPWSFRKDRCYRTVRAMWPEVEPDAFEGIKHNALDDAIFQAKHLSKILQKVACV